jgi:hypothetical protein
VNRPAQQKVGEKNQKNIEKLLLLIRFEAIGEKATSNEQCRNTIGYNKSQLNNNNECSNTSNRNSRGEAEESRSLKLKTDMLLVEVWARNLYQFTPFIPHAKSLDYKSDFYKIFIMESEREIAGTISDKVLSRTTAENPYPESEQAGYLKELWEL